MVLKYIPAGQIYRPGADESQQIGAVAAFMPEHFASDARHRSAAAEGGTVYPASRPSRRWEVWARW